MPSETLTDTETETRMEATEEERIEAAGLYLDFMAAQLRWQDAKLNCTNKSDLAEHKTEYDRTRQRYYKAKRKHNLPFPSYEELQAASDRAQWQISKSL